MGVRLGLRLSPGLHLLHLPHLLHLGLLCLHLRGLLHVVRLLPLGPLGLRGLGLLGLLELLGLPCLRLAPLSLLLLPLVLLPHAPLSRVPHRARPGVRSPMEWCGVVCLYQPIDDVSDRLAAFCDRTIPRWDGGLGGARGVWRTWVCPGGGGEARRRRVCALKLSRPDSGLLTLGRVSCILESDPLK
ncbi:hypothetical protein Smic_36400 [Streptomyces microflavus]|uniref:Uncharacterized protein n=1 Tax=Streptomyces microflavus TaxID=1919 RepID=A0A7J0CT22_STRMI|nr:hypothetical protein Smic_36400 [Streptomyces microflavus]